MWPKERNTRFIGHAGRQLAGANVNPSAKGHLQSLKKTFHAENTQYEGGRVVYFYFDAFITFSRATLELYVISYHGGYELNTYTHTHARFRSLSFSPKTLSSHVLDGFGTLAWLQN
jgi:hypothetical protein